MAVFPIDPARAAWNSSVTQKWEVTEATAASGKRRTLCQQNYPAWAFKVKFPSLTKAQVNSLTGFYAQMRGAFGSFFYKDYDDHSVSKAVLPSDDYTNYYCISSLTTMAEPVSKVENLTVYIDDEETTDYTVSNGTITLNTAVTSENVVSASYDFYYLVAFSGDLQITQVFDDYYSVSITLKVVRE